ncbi:MAG: hypothetical protein H0V95_08190 [Actinobacteria bacterium]|nr:hypothetical protein [Actinomycetota bacterium]
MRRVVVGLVVLVVLGVGCDSSPRDGANGVEGPGGEDLPGRPPLPDGRERPGAEDVLAPSPEALEACRAISSEEEAIERCLRAVRGYPDPLTNLP